MGVILFDSQPSGFINLETAKGSFIDNVKVTEISQFERNQFSRYSAQIYPFVKFRTSPSPIYNCHGMTFASRRTNIVSSDAIKMILLDDQYIRIAIEKTMPGDMVLYINPDDGDISHSGIVVECEHPQNDLHKIMVVSKWGRYREAVHHYGDCPYKDYEIFFYRVTHTEYEI